MKGLISIFLLAPILANADERLRPEFGPLAFVVGSCWEGDIDGRGAIDKHCFSPVFDGMHIRDRHQVTGEGEPYRGETIYSWNSEAAEIQYVYWNSIGGVSQGAVRLDGERITFPNETYAGADGSQISVQTIWVPDGANAYHSNVIERYDNDKVREWQVRYVRADGSGED